MLAKHNRADRDGWPSYLLYLIGYVVVCKGFIFCRVASLQMRMRGICQRGGLMSTRCLPVSRGPDAHLCLLDQDIHRSYTTSVASRHPIYFIHNETSAFIDSYTRCCSVLLLFVMSSAFAESEGSVENPHHDISTTKPAVQGSVVDVRSVLHHRQAIS